MKNVIRNGSRYIRIYSWNFMICMKKLLKVQKSLYRRKQGKRRILTQMLAMMKVNSFRFVNNIGDVFDWNSNGKVIRMGENFGL